MNKQRKKIDLELEALQNEMRETISKLDPKEMVWLHKPPNMPPILCKEPVVGAVPVCVSSPTRKPLTDREITSLMINYDFDSTYRDRIHSLIRAVELVHGIGGEA